MEIYRVVQSILLVCVTTLAVSLSPVQPVIALSNTPTYVLGVSSPLDPLVVDLQNLTSSVTILPSASYLSMVGPGSILFVDGSWLGSASSLNPAILSILASTVLQKVPTITVRGNVLLIATSISGLLNTYPQDLPLVSDGVYVASTLSNGLRQSAILEIVSGFDYAVQTEFYWAQRLLSNGSTQFASPSPLIVRVKSTTTTPATTTAAPRWASLGYFTVNTGSDFYPYGRIITTSEVYYLQNSNSTKYNWFNFLFNQTIQPGIMVFNSDWRTYVHNSLVQVTNTTSNLLASRGPLGSIVTSGPFTVSYSIGIQAGSLGANVTSTQTESYSLKHANVTDTSQPPNVAWNNNIDPRSSSGTLTISIVPGWTDRVLQSGRPSFNAFFATTFAELSGNQITNTHTQTYTDIIS